MTQVPPKLALGLGGRRAHLSCEAALRQFRDRAIKRRPGFRFAIAFRHRRFPRGPPPLTPPHKGEGNGESVLTSHRNRSVARRSQLVVAVVAERRRFCALAGAEAHRARAFGLPFQRLERCDLVRSVAERLVLGTAAAAPQEVSPATTSTVIGSGSPT